MTNLNKKLIVMAFLITVSGYSLADTGEGHRKAKIKHPKANKIESITKDQPITAPILIEKSKNKETLDNSQIQPEDTNLSLKGTLIPKPAYNLKLKQQDQEAFLPKNQSIGVRFSKMTGLLNSAKEYTNEGIGLEYFRQLKEVTDQSFGVKVGIGFDLTKFDNDTQKMSANGVSGIDASVRALKSVPTAINGLTLQYGADADIKYTGYNLAKTDLGNQMLIQTQLLLGASKQLHALGSVNSISLIGGPLLYGADFRRQHNSGYKPGQGYKAELEMFSSSIKDYSAFVGYSRLNQSDDIGYKSNPYNHMGDALTTVKVGIRHSF